MADVGRRRQAARGTERRGDRAVDEHAPRPRASTATSVAVGHRRSARGRLLLPPPGAEPCRAGGVSEALALIAVETIFDLGTARAAPACRCQARPAGRPIGADTGSRDRLTHSRGGYAGRGRGSGPLSRRRRAGRRKGSWACRKSDSCASRKEDLQTTRQLQLAGAEDRPTALLEPTGATQGREACHEIFLFRRYLRLRRLSRVPRSVVPPLGAWMDGCGAGWRGGYNEYSFTEQPCVEPENQIICWWTPTGLI